jgi:hypothetical protein
MAKGLLGLPSGGFDAALTTLRVGKYLVSPLVKMLDDGSFASSVSIRSGAGSATTDRVLRLPGTFPRMDDAAEYAHAEGMRWIHDSRGPQLAAAH